MASRQILIDIASEALLPKQREFLEATYNHRYTAYIGGVGSGKTLIGCLKAILYCIENPNSRGYIGTQTIPQLRLTTMNSFFELLSRLQIPKDENNWNKTEKHFRFPNGSTIDFMSFENETKLRGGNINFFYIDEATTVSEDIYRQLTFRLRAGKDQRAWITSNPDSQFHWMYEHIVEPALKGDDRYYLITAASTENTALPTAMLNDLENLKKVDLDKYRQMVLGEWVGAHGVIYKNFSPTTHIKIFSHDNFKSYFRSVDVGYTNPFCCLWIGIDNEDNVYVFDEYYRKETLDDEHLKVISQRHSDFKYTLNYVDPSAVQFRNNARSNYGIYFKPALNDVHNGILAVQKKMALKDDGTPSLYIHPRCENVIKELQAYKWAEYKGGDLKSEIKEQPIKKNDHAMDALRYMIYTYYQKFKSFKNSEISGKR